MTLRTALSMPLFDGLADPAVAAGLAAEAEAAGWHGFFTWDHMWWRAPVRDLADPWITLAAIAAVTERLRLGPMVTPIPRRRPAKLPELDPEALSPDEVRGVLRDGPVPP
jgi:alkanesulfonate monooxygenase SsuD/methylene tetrahydromethanopterin reductase-like flavin-dependent oxidoreductase (luciferase family)